MRLKNRRICRILIQLEIDELLHTVPQLHHAHDAGLGRFVQLRPHHAGIFPVVHLAVHNGIGIVFHFGVCRDGIVDFLVLTEIRQLRFLDLPLKVGNRLMELFGKIDVGERLTGRFHLVAVHAVIPLERPQHHLGMISKVAVDGDGDAVLGLAEMHPIRFNVDGPVALLEEKDVGGDFRSGVSLESVAGQTNRAEQFRALCDIPPDLRGLLIHRVTAGDKRDHAARTHLIERFSEKVIVDRKTELVVGPVGNLVAAERHVAHSEIKKVAPVGGFKARHGDVGVRVELLGDPARDAVQLHAVEPRRRHAFRQQAEKVSDAAGRFQNVAGLKAHVADSLIDGPDYCWAGVMGVQRRGPRHFVFLGGQRADQLRIFL
ncbi:hypothetical protein SDC9_133414 [bioreactor metagenome]|uniref:Uncharacterized protein n=1 Tax=bioreactor metagenome TaxID=1076179 RepID=A0A645DAR0_9ZZZZ